MKTNLTPDRKRISHDEYDAFIALEVVHAVLESPRTWPVLAERLKGVKYGARDKSMLTNALGRVLKDLYNTVPYEQLAHLSRNMKMSGVNVGVHINGRSKESEYGMCLSWAQIGTLMEATKEKCLVCTLDTLGQRKCPLAKILDEFPGYKYEHGKGCGYYGL